MANTLEAAGAVRQKTLAYNLNSVDRKALQGFFHYWATNKGNADLNFVAYSNSTVASDTNTGGCCTSTGWTPLAAAATVYVWYAKNDGTGDGTNAYMGLFNDTNNNSVANLYASGLISDDNDEFLFISPVGIAFGTDLTISSCSTSTASGTSSASANAANGFVIVAA